MTAGSFDDPTMIDPHLLDALLHQHEPATVHALSRKLDIPVPEVR